MSLIIDALTSPAASNFVQNSTMQVVSEGGLKAIGRPIFTLADKTATEEEKKYSATKEFLYQSLSMAAYISLIFPVRNNSYRALKYFPALKDSKPAKAKSKEEFEKAFNAVKDETLKTKIKGARELVSVLASGVILALITPRIVNMLVHPIMEKTGQKNKLDKKA